MHVRADDGRVFYVGKGVGSRAWREGGRTEWWSRVKNAHGLKVELCAFWPSEKDAYEHEKLLIECFREANMPLVNSTSGGDGGWEATPELRARLSASAKGRQHTAETKARMSASRTGRKRDPEAIAKMVATRRARGSWAISPERARRTAEALRGRKRDPAAVAKTAAANRGRPCSAETRAKISESNKRYDRSAAQKAAVSAITGRQQTPEHIAKRMASSAATRARTAPELAALQGAPE